MQAWPRPACPCRSQRRPGAVHRVAWRGPGVQRVSHMSSRQEAVTVAHPGLCPDESRDLQVRVRLARPPTGGTV